jgi:hypothetical protein
LKSWQIDVWVIVERANKLIQRYSLKIKKKHTVTLL